MRTRSTRSVLLSAWGAVLLALANGPGPAGPWIAAAAPGPPTNVTAVPGNGEATVSWIPPSGGGATNYGVYAFPATGAGVQVTPDSTLSMVVTGLTGGTYYTFTVIAFGGGWGSWSAYSQYVLIGTGPPPGPDVIWQENPALGAAPNFAGLETKPGSITVANDPLGQFGPSIRYETWDNGGVKSRAESRALRLPDGTVYTLDSSHEGQTFYLGWRALWDPMPTTPGSWIAFFQLHIGGAGFNGGAGPIAFRTLGDGQLHFQLIQPNGSSTHIWSTPLPIGTWNSFVLGFRLSRSGTVGWVELWYNGVQQTFINGSTQYPGITLWDGYVNPKWGVYRAGTNHGDAVAYLNHATFGTSYAAVAP